MKEHRIYYGFLQNPHFFVEVKKDLFDDWNADQIRNITHRRIVKWNLGQRKGCRSRRILMAFSYFKQGCGDTVRLLGTVGKGGYVDANSVRESSKSY